MRGPARTTANGVMRILRTMLEWARMQYRDKKAQFRILGLNPVGAMFQETARNRETPCNGRIPEEKLGTVYRALHWQSAYARSPVARTAADWLQFRLLTPARTTESAQLRFGDIDFVGGRLVLPADVTENCYPYRLPLNDPLRELLEHRRTVYLAAHPGVAAPPAQAWVFDSPTSKSGRIRSCTHTLQHVGDLCGVKIKGHDPRRTFMDVAIECRIDDKARARLLGHGVDVTQKHYENNKRGLIEPMQRIGAYFKALQSEPAPVGTTCNAPEASPSSVACGEAQPPAMLATPAEKPAWPGSEAPRLRAWNALTVAELAQKVWEKPTTHLAQEFGGRTAAWEIAAKSWASSSRGRAIGPRWPTAIFRAGPRPPTRAPRRSEPCKPGRGPEHAGAPSRARAHAATKAIGLALPGALAGIASPRLYTDRVKASAAAQGSH